MGALTPGALLLRKGRPLSRDDIPPCFMVHPPQASRSLDLRQFRQRHPPPPYSRAPVTPVRRDRVAVALATPPMGWVSAAVAWRAVRVSFYCACVSPPCHAPRRTLPSPHPRARQRLHGASGPCLCSAPLGPRASARATASSLSLLRHAPPPLCSLIYEHPVPRSPARPPCPRGCARARASRLAFVPPFRSSWSPRQRRRPRSAPLSSTRVYVCARFPRPRMRPQYLKRGNSAATSFMRSIR